MMSDKIENNDLNKQDKRLLYLDIARGFAMIMIFMIHLYSVKVYANFYVISFSLQLFYIISGCLIFYKRKDRYDLKVEIIKRIKNLMIPYVFFELIYDFLEFYQHGLNGFLISIKYAVSLTPLAAMWFLPAICIAEIVFIFLLEYLKDNRLIALNIIILYIIGLVLPMIAINRPTILLSRVLVALGFIYVGYISFKFINKIDLKTPYIIILIIIFAYLTRFNGVTSLYNVRYRNLFMFTFFSIVNSFLWILLSKKIQNVKYISKAITYIGTNTLVIMATHQKIIEIVVQRLINGYQYKNYLPGIIGMIIIMIIEIPIIEFINRKAPILAGKKKKSKILLIEDKASN